MKAVTTSNQQPLFWKLSDKEIQYSQPAVEVQAKLLLDERVFGFLISGKYYTNKRARNWAMKKMLPITYLLTLPEVTIEKGTMHTN